MNERQQEILELLKHNGKMSVNKLAKTLYVSEMTIRRDLTVMKNEGYIQRYNGGAIYIQNENILPIGYRKLLHSEEKKMLSQKIVPFLHDSMTVFVDCSSTCSYIIPLLAEFKDITVVTNSVYNLLSVAKHNIPCTLIGGYYQKNEMCTAGGMANEFLYELNFDIAFLSALGISDDGEITDNNESLTALRKIVIKRSKMNIFLFNNQKVNAKYTYTLCSSDDVTAVIF